MRIIAGIASLALLSGCQTLEFGGPGDRLNLQTDPPGALVAVEGAGECETPCVIKLDGPKKARIAKAGFVTQYVTLNPGGKKQIVVPLELAAASEDVDTTALPDLD
ncbi:PEGA domain-containing protein [Hyphococcus sp.]|uniref:PEGA domain-containing protein n=1 Tax=Hyphococcus sp. TaxID=2038636 RepID=UPI003CCBAE47